jgi:hypothetical protein
MFINNKYFKWYFSIIDQAINRELSCYTEKHHIIPRSLGGKDDQQNLVSLTPREHFICHLLLTKFTESTNKSKMITAAFAMVHRNGEKINSKIYETLRKEHKKNMEMFNPMKNPEARKKVSLANIGKISKRKGIPLSDDVKKKLSEKAKGRIPWNKGKKLDYNNGLITHTEETKLKIKEARSRQVIKHSDETKRKQSESAKRRWAKEKLNEFV